VSKRRLLAPPPADGKKKGKKKDARSLLGGGDVEVRCIPFTAAMQGGEETNSLVGFSKTYARKNKGERTSKEKLTTSEKNECKRFIRHAWTTKGGRAKRTRKDRGGVERRENFLKGEKTDSGKGGRRYPLGAQRRHQSPSTTTSRTNQVEVMKPTAQDPQRESGLVPNTRTYVRK